MSSENCLQKENILSSTICLLPLSQRLSLCSYAENVLAIYRSKSKTLSANAGSSEAFMWRRIETLLLYLRY